MKKYFLLVAIALLSFCNASINAQNNVIIGLLKTTPTQTIPNCTGDDLMALLNDDGEDWINSIECQNVKLVANETGPQFSINKDRNEPSYIKFIFKSAQILKATNVVFYGYDRQGELEPLIYVNDIPTTITSQAKTFTNQNSTAAGSSSAEAINDRILGNTSSLIVPRIYCNNLGDNNLINTCEIRFDPTAEDNIQLFALQVYYSNTQTSVADILEDDAEGIAKYYDLQGRELKVSPEKGLYIKMVNGKASKHFAK